MKNFKKIPLLNSEGNILEMFLNENCELIMRSFLRGEYHHIQFKPNKFALVRYLKNICPLSHLIDESEIMGLVFHEELIDIPDDFDFECIACYNNTIEYFSESLCHNEISKLKNMLELFFDKENWF